MNSVSCVAFRATGEETDIVLERQITAFNAATPQADNSTSTTMPVGTGLRASPLATQPSTFAGEAAASTTAQVDPTAEVG